MSRRFFTLALAILLCTNVSADPKTTKDLVVHEWGTFTSVAGQDGLSIEWAPLNGPTDLPSFVYRAGTDRASEGRPSAAVKKMRGIIRMETPVIYFYTPKKLRLFVNVNFPKGKVTEWYPGANEQRRGVSWEDVTVDPSIKASAFPKEKGDSHYYPARNTDAVPLSVMTRNGPQFERFLFYRGIGNFKLPLSCSLEGNSIKLQSKTFSKVIVLDVGKGRFGYKIVSLDAKQSVDRKTLKGKRADLEKDLKALLVNQGLFHKEAQSMIDTWKSHWFETGLRVFGCLPQKMTDELLPLHIHPKPEKIVRVLVGRVEIITPELEAKISPLIDKLGDKDYETREQASKAIHKKFGRFAEPILLRTMKVHSDPEVRARIRALLDKLVPKTD